MTNSTSPTVPEAASATVTAPAPQPVLAQPMPQPIAQTRALSMVSLVLSAAAILLGQGPLGIAGIIAGFVARRDEPAHRTLSTWGIVLGFVAVFGWLILALAGVAVFLPVWLGHAIGN